MKLTKLSNPRPTTTQPKKNTVCRLIVVFGPLFFSHSNVFFRGLGLFLYRKQTTRKPNPAKFSANTLLVGWVVGWLTAVHWLVGVCWLVDWLVSGLVERLCNRVWFRSVSVSLSLVGQSIRWSHRSIDPFRGRIGGCFSWGRLCRLWTVWLRSVE